MDTPSKEKVVNAVDRRREIAEKHLTEHLGEAHFDVLSSGAGVWEDAPPDTIIAVTIKYRSRANLYEVWEYVFDPEGGDPGEGTFARVAHTGDGDSYDYREFKYDPEVIS